MKLLARLLALFLIMPVVELFLLIQFEEWADGITGGYGLVLTLGLIFVTGVTGSYLAKREGLSAWSRLQRSLNKGGLPGKELLDGVIILVAGALLVAPGLLSDLAGLIGLFPPTRALIRKLVMKRIQRALRNGTLLTSFGGFEEAAWTSSSWPDAGEEAEPGAVDEEYWNGTSRDVPSHAQRRANPDAPSSDTEKRSSLERGGAS